jgi:periplasmic mercuric ion binding protein
MKERSMAKFTVPLVLGLLLASSGAAMAEQRTDTLAVENMYCEACPYMVKKIIEKVSGVSKVSVSFKDKTAVVVFDDARTQSTTSPMRQPRPAFLRLRSVESAGILLDGRTVRKTLETELLQRECVRPGRLC